MRCYECSQAGEVRDVVGICHHCSVALCADHARMIVDPLTARLPIAREVILPKLARRLLCDTCKTALEQPDAENAAEPFAS